MQSSWQHGERFQIQLMPRLINGIAILTRGLQQKEAEYRDMGGKLRKRFAERADFEKWMDRQCDKAIERAKVHWRISCAPQVALDIFCTK